MCSPQHSAIAVNAQSPQAPPHTRGFVTCDEYCVIPWHGGLRGCAVDVSRGGVPVREDSLESEVLPRCRQDAE